MKRATLKGDKNFSVPHDFNPRPREEGDKAEDFGKSRSEWISIHALVKRATPVLLQLCRLSSNFNPRPREEGDIVFLLEHFIFSDFNPRPREEGDRVAGRQIPAY